MKKIDLILQETHPLPASHTIETKYLFDQTGQFFNHKIIREHFKHKGLLSKSQVIWILNKSKTILNTEPNLLKIKTKCNIVGDIHGQYYDLINIIDLESDNTYLFLGDYVDRGLFSCETYLYLLILKITFPKRVYLLRGNHESLNMTSYFTFKSECIKKYDMEVYNLFLDNFKSLPIAGIVLNKLFCCHGGISPYMKYIKTIESINRMVEPDSNELLNDLLWADPHPLYKYNFLNEYSENTNRRCSFFYSKKAVNYFLRKNNLWCIVRGHEVQKNGYNIHCGGNINNIKKLDVKKSKNIVKMNKKIEDYKSFHDSIINGSKSDLNYKKKKYTEINIVQNINEKPLGFPSLITIFSAPNYCDSYKNFGAILKFDGMNLEILQYKSVEHPYVLPGFIDPINWSFPYISEKVGTFLQDLYEITDIETVHTDEYMLEINSFKENMNLMRTRVECIGEIVEEPEPDFELNTVRNEDSDYEDIKVLDLKNEMNIKNNIKEDLIPPSCVPAKIKNKIENTIIESNKFYEILKKIFSKITCLFE